MITPTHPSGVSIIQPTALPHNGFRSCKDRSSAMFLDRLSPKGPGHPLSYSFLFCWFDVCLIGNYFHHFQSPENLRNRLHGLLQIVESISWPGFEHKPLFLCLDVVTPSFPSSGITEKCMKIILGTPYFSISPSLNSGHSLPFHCP